MAESVTFTPPETGAEAPAPQAAPANLEKALSDTKAELTRAQQELAAYRKGTPPAAEPPANSPETPEGEAAKPEDAPAEGDEAAKEAVKSAGIDVAPFEQEFATTGDVSEENRAKLAEQLKAVLGEKAREAVDQFIDGKKVLRENYRNDLMSVAGGEDNYGKMLEWAKDNLKPDEIETYNRQVESSDINTIRFAIQGLKARYDATQPVAPSLLKPTAPASTNAGFSSTYEMRQAIADPRYKSDAAYRKQVEERIGKSNF